MKKRIAIVYDWMDSWGGVERVLLTLHKVFPEAVFYTSYYDQEQATWAKSLNIKTSFIQKLPTFIRKSRLLSLPLYPYAFESFDLSGYDVVISVCSAFAKGVITKPHTKHICYLLSPPRYLWGMTEVYLKNSFIKFLAAQLIRRLREWDYISSQKPDMYLSLSQAVAARCQKYYHHEAEVVYPPFNLSYWDKVKPSQLKREDYFLVVSRLEPYKRVDLVIDAFKNRKENVVIVGRGRNKKALKSMASKNVVFVENISDHDLADLYAGAKALIMPQEEDFGYVSLEAQFYGCPVIAYRKGGSAETVTKKTGIFFEEQTTESLSQALETFETVAYNVHNHLDSTEGIFKKFSQETFIRKILHIIQ